MTIPVCPYCSIEAKFVSGKVPYPNRPDLHELKFWACVGCDAYVGCHKGTDTPFGRLANKPLRMAKVKAHNAIDPLWQEGHMTRRQTYDWLASRLHIHKDQCHIGMFDEETCLRVVEIAKTYRRI